MTARDYSRAAGALVAAVGLLVLASWALDFSLIGLIVPGASGIKANAALCFSLLGIALLMVHGGANLQRLAVPVAAFVAAFVAAIAALTLSQDLAGWNAGIDELLFRDRAEAPGAPGRMAPFAAVNYLLLSASIGLLAAGRATAFAQGAAVAAFFVALVVVFGYLYGVSGLYRLRDFTPVAPHAAATFMVLSLGALLARPHQGWLRHLARDTRGAGRRRKVLLLVVVLLPFIGWLRVQGQRAGWFEAEVGVAIMVAATMLLIFGLIAHGSRTANEEEDRDTRTAERLRILHEVDRGLITHRAPKDIAEAALAPLRDLLGVPRAIVNLFDHEKGEVEWLAAIGRQRLSSAAVRYPIALMGDLAALRRGEPQVVDSEQLPPSGHRDALLASGVRYYMVVPMIVGEELIGALSFGGEVRDFPAERIEIAREVATQLAIAVLQARLSERIRQQAEELETRVRERTAELELANKELEAFSYTVSHDLRAPLRAVDGFARIFEEDYSRLVDEEGKRLLGVIRESSRRMGTLIDSLLAFSMLGRTPLHPAPIDMTQLAAEAWVELGADARTRCTLPPLPPAKGDRALLKQVWTNLLGNAYKYSSKNDAPAVEVSGSVADGEAVYCVADNGAGFDMRYYAKLFGVFQRLHSASDFAGTGVGLAIVQRIVVRHGGRVWAEGEPGRGARFYFSLPRRNDE